MPRFPPSSIYPFHRLRPQKSKQKQPYVRIIFLFSTIPILPYLSCHIISLHPREPPDENGFLTPRERGNTGTGVFYALLLALCGVHDEVIAHEYSLTDLGLAERKEEIVQRLIRGEALYGDRPGAVTMVSARQV
jgi:hypothetical protein